jgi:hypothetical protein
MLNFNMIFIKENFCLTTINQNRNRLIHSSPPTQYKYHRNWESNFFIEKCSENLDTSPPISPSFYLLSSQNTESGCFCIIILYARLSLPVPHMKYAPCSNWQVFSGICKVDQISVVSYYGKFESLRLSWECYWQITEEWYWKWIIFRIKEYM